MANTLYDNARKLFLEAGIHWINDDFRVLLVDLGTYTFQNTHQYVQAIPNEARIGPVTGVALGTNLTRTTDGGAADAPDVTFPSVSGPSIEAIVIYKDTGGVEATSPLIAFMDTATGLPITPNGGDIIITWDLYKARIKAFIEDLFDSFRGPLTAQAV